MRDQIVTMTINRNEMYNFQTNKVLSKNLCLVQVTKYDTAKELKFCFMKVFLSSKQT